MPLNRITWSTLEGICSISTSITNMTDDTVAAQVNYLRLFVCGQDYITSSSAMAETPRELGDFKRWVNMRLNFRLKGYVLHQYLWTVRWGNGHTFTAKSFHTKKLCSTLYSTEVELYS